MRKKLWCFFFVGMLACATVTLHADSTEKTMAEKLQEALAAGEEITGEEETEEDQTDLAMAWENLSAGQIITGIKDLDEDNLNADKVRALRKSYEKLSEAEKARVNNIDRLVQMEEMLNEAEEEPEAAETKGTENENAVTTGEYVKGRSYTFALGKSTTSLTLILSYTTDDNNDGLGDTPDITLTFPDGTVTELTSKMTQLSDRKSQLVFLWQQNYMQIDVAYGMEGRWTIETSVPVTFSRSDYRGDRNLLQPLEEPAATESQESTEGITASSTGGTLNMQRLLVFGSMMVVLIGGIVAAVIFLPKMLVKGNGTKEKSKKEPLKHQMTEEEEMALLLKTLEEQKAQFWEQDLVAETEVRRTESRREVAEPISETLEEVQSYLDSDDSVEEDYVATGNTDVLAPHEEVEAPVRRHGRHF